MILAILGVPYLVVNRVFTRLDALEQRLDKSEKDIVAMKQRIADGGTHDIVSQLSAPKSPESVAANMTLVKAQIAVARTNGKEPNQEKIAELAPAMASATRRYPQVDSSWDAVSAMVSYRTSSVQEPPDLPDCNSLSAQTGFAPADDFPEIASRFTPYGYYFHDCKLHLDRLPGKSKTLHFPNGLPDQPTVKDGHIGEMAFAKNVVIVLGASGVSDTDIIQLNTKNCRFQVEVTKQPDVRTQRFLLAALDAPSASHSDLPL